MTTNVKPLSKWFTYDDPPYEPSNQVLCEECSKLFWKDPSLRELQDQRPDNNLKCASCGKVWE